jgi:hypothetical protein
MTISLKVLRLLLFAGCFYLSAPARTSTVQTPSAPLSLLNRAPLRNLLLNRPQKSRHGIFCEPVFDPKKTTNALPPCGRSHSSGDSAKR